ncbi:MAG: DUF4271 domain-containing protein [Bacteroidales bacterium]|nr:DUF4271 domain-containing protein [Bacteroidales bacterium]
MKNQFPEIVFNMPPQQDSTSLVLSPYLQNYYRYLRSVEKDSFFHKKYNLATYNLFINPPEKKQDNKLWFVKDSIIISKNDSTVQPALPLEDTLETVSKNDSILTETLEIPKFDANNQEKTLSKIEKFDWYLIVIIGAVIFFAWIRFFFRRELDKIFESLFNNQTSHKVFLEQNANTQRASFLLNFLFVLSMSFFLFFVAQFSEITLFNKDKPLLFLLIYGIIILVYLLKLVVYKILGNLLLAERECNEYLHNVFLYNKAVGISLLPISIGLSYLPPNLHFHLLITGGILFAISFIARVYRGLQISYRAKVSPFYLFLYLCTLEIAPFLVLFKYFGILGFK